MEDGALEGQPRVPLVGAEDAEVFRHQGHLVLVQLHLDPVLLDDVDGDVEEHILRRRRHLERSKTRVLEQYFPCSSMVINSGFENKGHVVEFWHNMLGR